MTGEAGPAPDPTALSGRVALVTGGASGIGAATAVLLAQRGALVAVVDRDADGGRTVCERIVRQGGRAGFFWADLSNAGLVVPLVDQVTSELGPIDVLVNGAGRVGAASSVLDVSLDEVRQVYEINLVAPLALIQVVARQMVDRGARGQIVNVTSSAAFRASRSEPAYSASKAALAQITRTAAATLGPHGIQVNAVAPGVTRTPIMVEVLGSDDAADEVTRSGPLANLYGRCAEPEDVAEVIAFLCTPASRQITGQVVHASAGAVV